MKHLFALLLFLAPLQTFAKKTPLLAGGGFGLVFNPTLVLLNPQLEFPIQPRLWMGPMIQAGFGSGVLMTLSGTARYVLGDHPRLKPSIEGALGLSVADYGVGVHIGLGMGFDYWIDRHFSLGTFLRANFGPPLVTFFFTWPLIVARIVI